MSDQIRLRAVRYGRDNNLNAFGDYTTLVQCAQKNEHGRLCDDWWLEGPGLPIRPLTTVEVTEVLLSFFCQHSEPYAGIGAEISSGSGASVDCDIGAL